MKIFKIIAAVFLALHGLIHLMGTASYLKLAEVQGLPHKTTVFAGRWDLGEAGIALFGVLWAVAAIGFVAVAVAWMINRAWWQAVLLWVTLFSLLLTVLDWQVAIVGVVINLVILVALGLTPFVTAESGDAKRTVRG